MNSSAESIPANMSNVTTSYYHPQQNQQFLTNFNNPTNNQTTLNNTTMTNDLPKQFVSSLRILFDILDENHSGFVRLSDIESRWKEDGVKGLPSGVVDALKRVTPANGYLNFDRFVAGLKLVLWRSKHGNMVSGDGVGDISIARLDESQEPGKENQLVYNIDDDDEEDEVKPVVNMGLQSAAQHQFNNFSDQIPNNTSDGQFITNNIKQSNISSTNLFGNNSGAIPNSTNLASYGPRSRPNYPQTNFGYQNTSDYASTSTHTGNGYPRSNHPNTSFSLSNNTDPSRVLNNDCLPSSSGSALPGDKLTPQQMQQHQRLPYVTRCPERPPLQPRQPHGHHYNNIPPVLPDRHQSSGDTSGAAILQRPFSPPIVPPRDQNKANILNELKNWQRQRMKNLPSADPLNARHAPSHPEWGFNNRNPNTDTKEVDSNKNNYVNIDSFQQRRNPEEYGAKKSSELRHSSRRWDGRRHTLTSGVDHSMIKRMRQLEEEKEMLVQGMEVVESARLWYQKRLALINDKQKLAAWSSFNDSSLEASQERMNFQKTRISEVNQQLKTLIESSERGFPLHMNLAIGNAGHPLVLEDNSVKMLKEQNKQLTEEISTKCDKITQLEQEKQH